MKNEFQKRILTSFFLIPLALLFIIYGSTLFLFFICVLFLFSSYEWIKMNKENNFIKILGVLFLILSFYSAYKLRDYVGLNIFLFIILICVFTDIGGFVFGKLLKGPKFTKISPNKTYFGVLGSFITPTLIGFIYYKYMTLQIDIISPLKLMEVSSNHDFIIILIILFISLISQVGDLIISYFKRLAKVKDTGKILPGHGGLLDRVDGLIFVVPIYYLFIVV